MLKGKCKVKLKVGEKEVDGYFIKFFGYKMFLCWTLNKGMENTLSVIEPQSGITVCYLDGGLGDLESKAKIYEKIFGDIESFEKVLKMARQDSKKPQEAV